MAFQGDSIFWVEVEKIVPNPFQPRREFDEDKLRELSESIRMYGVLQPLTVTRKEIYDEDGSFRTEYELIAGERRLRASRLAGLEQVPVLIRSGEQTEQEKLELAIIENLQREDLNAVDRALAFKQLADMFTLSHSEVAKKVGRSREYVSNSIRLLSLPEVILEALKRGEISEGHARTLLMLKERPEEQNVVFREILLKKLSVREVERISRKIATDKVRKHEWKDTDAHLIEMERAFTDTLGTRVQISKTDFGGKLTIDYFSETDLEKLLAVIKTKEGVWETPPVAAPEAEATGETVIRTMDEMVAPLQDIVDATPLEMVEEAVAAEAPWVEASAIPFVPYVPPVDTPEQVSAIAPQPAAPEEASVVPVMAVAAPALTPQEATVDAAPHVSATAPSVEAVVSPPVAAAPYVPPTPVVTHSVVMPTAAPVAPYEAPAPVPVSPVVAVPPVSAQAELGVAPGMPYAVAVSPAAVLPTEVPQAVPTPQPIVAQPAEAPEDELYSMKNFSL
jgi:ParB family transcriptional regulator, chromosome partitioning protein